MIDTAVDILPTRARLHADPRFTGQGITIALVDSGFYPHPDLIKPANRIRAWADANDNPLRVLNFKPDEEPTWPGYDDNAARHWHGLMTSTVAAGNGACSDGLYCGVAPDAQVVLIRASRPEGGIPNENIIRALNWLVQSAQDYNIRIVSLSVAGDPIRPLFRNPIDKAIEQLVQNGVVVVSAAGNDGVRRLVPPATAPDALTIGGVDDHNTFDPADVELWHSNYGESSRKLPKPEIVAPSIWVAAPILPHSELAAQAQQWFAENNVAQIAAQKLITPDYQHVEGTSFAAPMVAGTVACMLQANPRLTPFEVRRILIETATPVPNADPDREGGGMLNAGDAVRRALAGETETPYTRSKSPQVLPDRVVFIYRDPRARSLEVFGEWNGWQPPGISGSQIEDGIWIAEMPKPSAGFYAYRLRVNGETWIDDPDNPNRRPNDYGEFDSILVIG